MVSPLSVECVLEGGGEHLVATGIVDRADADGALRAQGDRDAEVGDALDIVQAAADGIDDPQVLGVER